MRPVDLLVGHEGFDCCGLAEWARLTLADYTEAVAISEMPSDIHHWEDEHRTARRRALKAQRLGYVVRHIEPRDNFADRWAINHSAPNRQGRRMSRSYLDIQPTDSTLPPRSCDLHHTVCYGVFDRDDVLVAYSTFYRVGELVWLSMFLGHAEHLDAGIMYLLWREMLREQISFGPGVVFYNRWDSGQPGLRWFKEKVGLGKMDVTWTR